MASTNKTQNIGLSLWELGDKPAMEDFNADNKRLDTVLDDIKDRLSKQDLREQLEAVNQQLRDLREELAGYRTEAHSIKTIVTPSFSDSWGYYAKVGKEQISVHFRAVKDSALKIGDIIAVLPQGYQPVSALNLVRSCPAFNMGKSILKEPVVIRVDEAGQIIVLDVPEGSKSTHLYFDFLITDAD